MGLCFWLFFILDLPLARLITLLSNFVLTFASFMIVLFSLFFLLLRELLRPFNLNKLLKLIFFRSAVVKDFSFWFLLLFLEKVKVWNFVIFHI